MTERRIILEMGSGNDLYGCDYTKAACRAVQDALHHSSIVLFKSLGYDHREMRVQVTIGVADSMCMMQNKTPRMSSPLRRSKRFCRSSKVVGDSAMGPARNDRGSFVFSATSDGSLERGGGKSQEINWRNLAN